MAFLVTGGAGFIGSHVVRQLVDQGETVVVYARSGKPIGNVLGRSLSEVPVVQGNIDDLANLLDTVQRHDVDTIIHCASLLSSECRANPRAAVQINVGGFVNLLEVVRLKRLRRLIWSSSAGVFGPPHLYGTDPVANDAPQYPWGVYGACKSFCEQLALNYSKDWDVDSIGVRFTIVYGPGRLDAGLTRELIDKPATGKPSRVPFGDDVLNWLYVEDAARAIILAARAARPKSQAYNIVGDLQPVQEAVSLVRALLPEAAISARSGYFGASFNLDGSQAAVELGYEPRWTLKAGLQANVNFVRAEHGLGPVAYPG